MRDSPLMLSVSGLRGLVGRSLTPVVAARYGAAFGSWLREATGADRPRVVVGRDSRPSGEMIERAATAGLIATGCRVTTLGIVTTPTVAVMAEHLRADGGMVITASHNPIEWNGIKALGADGAAPPAAEADRIIERFAADRIDYAGVDDLQPADHDDSANGVHVGRVLDHVDVEAIRRYQPRVVLDSIHGAGGPAGAALLAALGVEPIHRHAEPTGRFPHDPEPTEANLVDLCDAVREHGAAVGFAQDPDADRLALIDESGRYIGEEYTLALCTLHVLANRASAPPRASNASCDPTGRGVAVNLSTSRMIDDIAVRFGAAVHRTPVGEAHVADAVRRHRCAIGGEGNGGVIFPEVVHVRDSLSAIALILELLATTGRPLSEHVASPPRYTILKEKLPLAGGPPGAKAALAALRAAFAGERLNDADGLRIDLPDGWLHVRPSNTEPILRLIAEAPDPAAARRLLDRVRPCLASM